MKKLMFSLSVLLSVISSLPAQTIKTAGVDTLLYIPFRDIFVNTVDQANFKTNNEDKDGYPVNTSLVNCDWTLYGGGSFQSKWNMLYKKTGVDTNFCIGTPWAFNNDAYQANDWYTFGPITIPSDGATFKWSDRVTDPNDRNGYEVRLSTTGLESTYFTSAPIFSRPDMMDDPTVTTNWYPHTKVLSGSSYGGKKVYFAIHHNATDVSTLQMDNIIVLKGTTTGIEEFNNEIAMDQNFPNPFSQMSTVGYELKNSAKVNFEICDITGKQLVSMDEGIQHAGINTLTINASSLAKGIYFYSVKANGFSLTRKMIVTE